MVVWWRSGFCVQQPFEFAAVKEDAAALVALLNDNAVALIAAHLASAGANQGC